MDIDEFCRGLDEGTISWETVRKREEETQSLREEADRKLAALDRGTKSTKSMIWVFVLAFIVIVIGGFLAHVK